jgi:hypothetical protein
MAENVKVTRWPVYGSDLFSIAAGQRKQSSSGLTIVFSKLVTLAGNRGCLLRMVFDNCNQLIYCAVMTTS